MRLQRVGKKNRPTFRVVLMESKRSPKSGDFLEILGNTDRILKTTQLKEDRIKYWLSQGVQPSDAVHNMLVRAGVTNDAKIPVHSLKVSKKKAAARVAEAEKVEKANAEKVKAEADAAEAAKVAENAKKETPTEVKESQVADEKK